MTTSLWYAKTSRLAIAHESADEREFCAMKNAA